MRFQLIEKAFDLVVCGGGMSGICAAIQASRLGLTVALVNNRGVLGGNASPEIRVHVCGATGTSEFNLYARESGIIGELLIENRYRNPQGNVYLWHTVLIDAIRRESNISVFLNTCLDTVHTDGNKITSVEGTQNGSEKRYCLQGNMFIDDTGDGTIGYLAGAEYMYGREGKAKWNENIAPTVEDEGVLLSSLSFYTKDFHREMPYQLPEFASEMKEEFQKTLSFREIPDRIPEDARYDGYRFQWYYETGAGRDQMLENESIMEDHSKLIYNVWYYIKNQSGYDAKQFDLEYISPVAGKRESRRLVGEYILKEQDVAFQTDFEDGVGYGGWSIDLHAAGGFFDNDLINRHFYLRGVYQIPFRCCIVKGISNLMVASRCLSVSHVASGTTRLMSTLSLLGQACGSAAKLCAKYQITPQEVSKLHMEELQQLLQQMDQGIIGKKKEASLITKAKITTSSYFQGKLPHTDVWMKLAEKKGFVIPISEQNTTLTLFAKAEMDTELVCKVYKPSKIENYGPDIYLGDVCVAVAQTKEATAIELDFGQMEYEKYLFLVVEENSLLEIEVADRLLNGYRMLEQRINEDDTFVDIATLESKPYLWVKSNILPVFEHKSTLYDGSNINNGYIRNYGQPNLWLSELDDVSPEVCIELAQESTVTKVALTFDNLCDDFDYDTMEHVYDSNVWEQVIKDYDLYGYTNGEWELLREVRNNYQRRNMIEIKKVKYGKIKVKLLATNGAQQYGIYDIELMS